MSRADIPHRSSDGSDRPPALFAAVRLTSPHDVMIDKPLPNVMQQRRRCKLAQLIMRKPQPCADYHRKDAHMNGMVIDIIIITLDVHDIAHDVSIAYHIIDHRLHRFAQLKLRFRRFLLPHIRVKQIIYNFQCLPPDFRADNLLYLNPPGKLIVHIDTREPKEFQI